MTTTTATAFTSAGDAAEAGRDLGRQLRDTLKGERPDAAIVFASAQLDPAAFLAGVVEACDPRVLVGASSAGEFTGESRGEGSACALAIRSPSMTFTAVKARNVGADHTAAARTIAGQLRGLTGDYPYRTALVLTDALAGHAAELVEELTLATSGKYQFAGGGAGDDAKFTRTWVFNGAEAYTDAVVALEILSTRPVGIGVQHGWAPASEALRVTEIQGARLISLDGFPAAEAFEEHAERTGQRLDRAAPLPFFLHNILGVATPTGHLLRVPLAIDADGSVTCAAEIQPGATVHIMKTTNTSAIDAARSATDAAVRGLGGGEPAAALFFDCVATRLRMGDVFGFELEAVEKALGGAHLVGCNTYGQIARADGQFGGFHNCTAVVVALPRE